MVRYNRGEWSEVYSLFEIIEKGYIIDHYDLNNKILVQSIIYEDHNIEFLLSKNQVDIKIFKKLIKTFPTKIFKSYKDLLFVKIKENKKTNGAFSIDEISFFLEEISILSSIKAKSLSKQDIILVLADANHDYKNSLRKSYSIKSNIGSHPTLFNSSQHTNFGFFLTGINDAQLNHLRSIKTADKLIDRLAYLNSMKANIRFDKVLSPVFLDNLTLISDNLPTILGNALLNSYKGGSKDFLLNVLTSNKSINENELLNITADFLKACSFGLFPSKPWDKNYSLNGGFLLLSPSGVLSKIEIDSRFMNDYLLRSVKFDSPSSTRFKMLEPEKIGDNVYYFTLNLQIRFHK